MNPAHEPAISDAEESDDGQEFDDGQSQSEDSQSDNEPSDDETLAQMLGYDDIEQQATPMGSDNPVGSDVPMVGDNPNPDCDNPDPDPDPATQPCFCEDWTSQKIVDFHLDLEHAGEVVGIVQISWIAVNPYNMEELARWNRYVQIPAEKHKFWNITGAEESHGLKPNSPEFQDAEPLAVIWPTMIAAMEALLHNGEKSGRIVAWGGKGCDIEWFFRTTELCDAVNRNTFKQPRWTPYFWDPVRTIRHYGSCPLNVAKSQIIGYGLGTVYCFVTESDELVGAESAAVAPVRMQKVLALPKWDHAWDGAPAVLRTNAWRAAAEATCPVLATLQAESWAQDLRAGPASEREDSALRCVFVQCQGGRQGRRPQAWVRSTRETGQADQILLPRVQLPAHLRWLPGVVCARPDQACRRRRCSSGPEPAVSQF
eukprot:SAG31_NODE_980_length_10594_cov_7.565889_9_plen_427_part_00